MSITTETAAEVAAVGDRPAAPLRTDTFRKQRPSIVGSDAPESPFPIELSGDVQRGFGRGGKDLGCPTG
jgi:riboflavin kinase